MTGEKHIKFVQRYRCRGPITQEHKVTPEEAQKLFERFMARYPEAAKFIERTVEVGRVTCRG